MISYGTQLVFRLEDNSGVAVVRRAGGALARELQFDETRAGQLALVITEAATNIVKHAGHGEILLRALHQKNENGIEFSGVEVIAIDKGPGITNLNFHMEDGNSTVGSYGIGLGTVRRLSHEFDIYSSANNGTALWIIIWAEAQKPAQSLWQIGAICVPIEGEEVCGDNWAIAASQRTLTLMVADGLGHGPDAAIAANAAVALVTSHVDQTPSVILQRAHTALQGTRGAAVAVSKIDPDNTCINFAGVGNISVCVFYTGNARHLLSHNGIVGNNLRKLQEFSEAWDSNALLIAHSDGINTRWNLDSYPYLRQCHPGLIAAVLYRDFSRGRDDATVVVVRETGMATGETLHHGSDL
ncbi:MAG: serine/threonine protein kinase [Cellvibrio sp. 79]|nr:MAG: serine/threonine protein kinase [Cellvibrio sp. 79]